MKHQKGLEELHWAFAQGISARLAELDWAPETLAYLAGVPIEAVTQVFTTQELEAVDLLFMVKALGLTAP